MTIFSMLPLIALMIALLWPIAPVKQKPRWIDFMPAVALGLTLLDLLVDGFQAAFFGFYLFCLVLFLLSIPRLRKYSPTINHRVRAILGGLFGFVLLAFCLLPPVLIPFNYQAVKPTGPYAVGTVTHGWEDPNRPETFTPDSADHRKITVQFWYPVDSSGKNSSETVENAPLSTKVERYPLVVFSHGAFGVRGSNTTTYTELASRGYIVASIDHAYHAFYTRFPDGKTAVISQQFLNDIQRNQSGQMSEEESFRTALDWMDLRTADIRFTMDQIQALNAGKEQSLLAGHIDEAKMGLFGHSLGGAAVASVCRTDARCKAAIVIDATMFGEYDPASQVDAGEGPTLVKDPYPRPLMIFYNGDTYHATAEHLGYEPDLSAYNNAVGPAYSVIVNGAQHLNFTDLPARAPILASLLGNVMTVNGGTAGSISQARCMEILDRYVVDFFNQSLKGESAPLLSGTSPFPEVEFSARP